MKTLLSIGVFVAVIFWSSGKVEMLKCWGQEGHDHRFVDENDKTTARFFDVCVLNGTARHKNCTEITCSDEDKEQCARYSLVNKKTTKTMTLLFCATKEVKCDVFDSTEQRETICPCNTELCNDGICKAEKKDGNWTCIIEPIKKPDNANGADGTNGADGADGTLDTHLIIAFIVGAIFFP